MAFAAIAHALGMTQHAFDQARGDIVGFDGGVGHRGSLLGAATREIAGGGRVGLETGDCLAVTGRVETLPTRPP